METKISKENQEKVRERVLLLIEAEFGSDAAFERTMGLPQKTVNKAFVHRKSNMRSRHLRHNFVTTRPWLR